MPQNRAARPISLAFGMMACGAEVFFKQARGETRLFCEVGSVTKSAAGKSFGGGPPWVFL
jgi:hypothetical protein